MTLPDGLLWLHCTGPDGPVVLLGEHDSRTQSVTLIDNAYTRYMLEGPWLHKWRIYAFEEVERPTWIDHGWVDGPFGIIEVHVKDGAWLYADGDINVPPGVQIFSNQRLDCLIAST